MTTQSNDNARSARQTQRTPGLTRIQRKVAQSLSICRPAVLEGTRVILDPVARHNWYQRVTEAMKANGVKDANVGEFCDIAGVPN